MLCASFDAARFPETVSKVSTKSVASKKRTAVTKGTDSDRSKPLRSSQSDDEIECVECTETVTSEMKTVSCDVCRNVYRQECTGMSGDVLDVLTSIISCTGWVCRDCEAQFSRMKYW